MTEQAHRPVGSVAEETGRLLAALLATDTGSADPSAGDAPAPDGPDAAVSRAPSRGRQGATTKTTAAKKAPATKSSPTTQRSTKRASAAASSATPEPTADREGAASETGPCPECGHQVGGTLPVTCQLCPLCQVINVMRSVNPETVDRLADLAAAVAETLRDVAASRWTQAGGQGSARARPTVQDIDVSEGDADPAPGDEADR